MKYYAILKYNSEYNSNCIIAMKKTAEEAVEFIEDTAKEQMKNLLDMSEDEVTKQWTEATEYGDVEGHVTVYNFGKPSDFTVMIYYGDDDDYEEYYSIAEANLAVYIGTNGVDVEIK